MLPSGCHHLRCNFSRHSKHPTRGVLTQLAPTSKQKILLLLPGMHDRGQQLEESDSASRRMHCTIGAQQGGKEQGQSISTHTTINTAGLQRKVVRSEDKGYLRIYEQTHDTCLDYHTTSSVFSISIPVY